MFFGSKLTETDYLLEKSLDVETLRRKLISNNIANVNVPHFKRSEVNFESELKRAISDKNNPDRNLPAKLSNERHIPFYTPKDVRSVKPRIVVDYNTSFRNDDNSVDIEKEMVDSAKNTMRYNALVRSLNHNFKMMKLAMRK